MPHTAACVRLFCRFLLVCGLLLVAACGGKEEHGATILFGLSPDVTAKEAVTNLKHQGYIKVGQDDDGILHETMVAAKNLAAPFDTVEILADSAGTLLGIYCSGDDQIMIRGIAEREMGLKTINTLADSPFDLAGKGQYAPSAFVVRQGWKLALFTVRNKALYGISMERPGGIPDHLKTARIQGRDEQNMFRDITQELHNRGVHQYIDPKALTSASLKAKEAEQAAAAAAAAAGGWKSRGPDGDRVYTFTPLEEFNPVPAQE